jgi:hypothetical protein
LKTVLAEKEAKAVRASSFSSVLSVRKANLLLYPKPLLIQALKKAQGDDLMDEETPQEKRRREKAQQEEAEAAAAADFLGADSTASVGREFLAGGTDWGDD